MTYLLSNHEPQYEDRALSEWLNNLDGGIANSEIGWLAAEEAIRQMGRKSLPYLIRLLKTEALACFAEIEADRLAGGAFGNTNPTSGGT